MGFPRRKQKNIYKKKQDIGTDTKQHEDVRRGLTSVIFIRRGV
jgi:hypothetical protein